MNKYLVIDTESVFDPYLREAYECIESGGRARIGCRSLVAISMWPIEIDSLGRIDTGDLTTWTLEGEHTEGELLASAFTFMRRYHDHVLVSYGGLAVDCQVLQLAAMGADLELPRQLKEANGPRWRDLRHIDLGLALKGSGKTWHHLSEVMIRMGLPVAALLGKADPTIRPGSINWHHVRQHCERDVLWTAMVLIAWIRLQGNRLLGLRTGHFALIESFIRQCPDATQKPILRRMADELQEQVVDTFDLAA